MADNAKPVDQLQSELLTAITGLKTSFEAELSKGLAAQSDKLVAIQKEFDDRTKALEVAQTKRHAAESLPGSEDFDKSAGRKFSFSRAISGVATGNWTGRELEFEALTGGKAFTGQVSRDMSAGTDSAGGFMVPEQVMLDQVIPLLKAEAVIYRLGITELPGLSGSPVKLPKQTGASTAYRVAEGVSVTSSDAAIGQIDLVPHDYAARVILSKRLMTLSAGAADALVKKDIVEQIALLIDNDALHGTGASGAMTGVINLLDAGSTYTWLASNATDYEAYEDLVNMEHVLRSANGLRGTPKWVLNPTTLRALRKIKSQNASAGTDSGDMGRHLVTDPAPNNIIGYGYETTTQLTATAAGSDGEVIFGNWSDYILGRWGGMELATSDQTSDAFAKRQVHILGVMTVDGNVRNVDSFVATVTAKQ